MSSDVSLALRLVQKDFSLDEEALPESVSTLEELETKLIPIINYMLNKDMSRLLNALYRIDISESKVKKVLMTENPDDIAAELAELIIQREMQKVITRRKYRDHSL